MRAILAKLGRGSDFIPRASILRTSRRGTSCGARRQGCNDRAQPSERKNPLTLESYGELRDTFRDLVYADDIKAVVITGAGGNFCSGGDVHEIIGPLVEMQRQGDVAGLLAFTRMTGDVVKAMRGCPQPIVAAVDGICAGAGAILAMASDLRLGTARSKVAFLFVRVGLAGADMGACNMLPRIIGAGARPSSSIPAARWTAARPSAGASTAGSASRKRC